MKTKMLILIGALAVCGAATNLKADSIFQPLFDANQWTLGAGYGHSVSGPGRNLAFADIAYNFNTNVAVVAGYDYLWSHSQHQANVVKGGVTLKTSVYPLRWTGVSWLTNRVANPWAGEFLANPVGNTSNIGNLTVAGADFDLFTFGQFNLSIDGIYENRSGQGIWDGNYAGVFLAVSRNKYTLQVGVGQVSSTRMEQQGRIAGPQLAITKTF